MNGEREKLLARIGEALAMPAPKRHHGSHAAMSGHEKHGPTVAPGGASTSQFREWLPPVGQSYDEQHALFARQSSLLKTEFCDCADLNAAAVRIAELARAGEWKRIALHSGALTNALAGLLPEGLEVLRTDGGYDKNALEACDAGLTECECLVAQTGSVCVTSRSAGGRALSVLPPHHLVIARRGQLVPDLTAAYAHLAARYRGEYPSFVGFITGPSRTGDIERILVLGAHGPRFLTVFLVP